MNLTKFAFENKPLTYTFLAVFCVLGFLSYLGMPRNSMPPFLVRFASVVTQFPGASPERVEELVTSKIEEAIQEIPEVDYITSESRTGISIVSVAIKESETDLQPIFDDMRRKVDRLQGELPQGIQGPVVDDDLGDVFGIFVGITGDGFSYAEIKDIADDVRHELIKISDAAKVVIVGNQEENIFIDYDNARLADLGLTQGQLQNILATTNIISPGGRLVVGPENIIVEPSGNFESIEDLKNTLINVGQENLPIPLGDLTNIYRGYIDPPESLVRVNGDPGLVLGISLKDGGNIVTLGQLVDKKVRELQQIYPHGVDIKRVLSQDIVVAKSVNDFLENLLQSVAVVLFVMLIFLGLRTGLVVASLIPVAIVMGIMFMDNLNVGLDKVSLAALIIALGMLVDNAIVMSESIMVKMEAGVDSVKAAIDSSNELMVPLLVSTMTTSAAFVSFYLAKSTMGEVVGPIFVVVTVVLLSSWLAALTLIPLLCIAFIKVKKQPTQTDEKPSALRSIYRRMLVLSLKNSLVFSVILVVLFVASIWGLSLVPSIFLPDDDRNLVYADLEMPIGTTLERTTVIVDAVEAFTRENLLVNDERDQGVVDWSAYIGKGAPKYDLGYTPSEGASHLAHLVFNTDSDASNDGVIQQLEIFCRDHFPELTATVSRLASGGGSSNPIAIRISGKSADKLFDILDQVKNKLRHAEGTRNVKDNWGMRSKKMIVSINQASAQRAGITNQDIATSLQTVLSGIKTGEFREGDKVIPVMMRDAQQNGLTIEKLEGLNIFSQNTGRNVPLTQVADLGISWQASKIMRRDLNKTITVTSDLAPGITVPDVLEQVLPWLETYAQSWPNGYSFEVGGESENSADAMNAVAVNLPIAFFAILLLLIGQFNSFKKPLIVLLTIPLGFIGVVFGLLIARSYFGFFAFLGVISLAGIVINNAIVLLDRIQIESDSGLEPAQAILTAAQQRFRPIMLTTATTSLGLIPLWLGGGPMFEPLAISVIFGLLFATVITLLFVPVLYKILYGVSFKDIS